MPSRRTTRPAVPPPTPPAPDVAPPTVSVAAIRRTRAGLVEVLFGLPDMTRRRVVMPVYLVSIDHVTWTAQALLVLNELERGRT